MFLSNSEALSDPIGAPGLVPALPRSPCDICSLHNTQFCGALFAGASAGIAAGAVYRTTAARRNVYRAGEASEGVLVICEGWAVRFVQLPNGKRQILSVLLPGEVVSASALAERQLPFSVQAVTDVRYCCLPFGSVRARMQQNPDFFDFWLRLSAAEHRDAEMRLVDLGQRAAQERIAALVAHLLSRFERRGELEDDEFPFPMSQQQIADFTGLTPVHTCRVLSWLRQNGICEVGHGTVKVVNRGELHRLAAVR